MVLWFSQIGRKHRHHPCPVLPLVHLLLHHHPKQKFSDYLKASFGFGSGVLQLPSTDHKPNTGIIEGHSGRDTLTGDIQTLQRFYQIEQSFWAKFLQQTLSESGLELSKFLQLAFAFNKDSL